MPDNAIGTLAIVGAAGFVGRVLLRRLEDLDIRATAIVRGAPELAIEGKFHEARSPSDASGRKFDTVINLAYPNSGTPLDFPVQNEAIRRTVGGLVPDEGRIIQVSTQAVFGLALDRAIQPGPVETTRDYPYVEAKIEAERAFSAERDARGLALDIVRLGNIWGPASAGWGVSIVQRLITGRPVGVAGIAGTSNVTDVANVADYLAFLLGAEGGGPGLRYHHLAEFSAVPWTDWIDPVAEALAVQPVDTDPSALQMPNSGPGELLDALGTPRALYRVLANERRSGSVLRAGLRRLPPKIFTRLKGSELTPASPREHILRAEQTFLAIMSSQQEFRSVLQPGWAAEVDQEQSLDRFLEWLSRN